MKKCFSILVLFFIALVNAKSNTDSLKNAMIQSNARLEKAKLAIEVAENYYNNEGLLDSSFVYFEKALHLFKKQKDLEGISQSYAGMGLIYREKGIYTPALKNYLLAYDYALKSKSNKRISKALIGIGVVHHIKQDHKKALYYYRKAEEANIKNDFKPGLASVYNNTGLIYSDTHDAEKALNYFRKSLKIDLEINDERGIATVYENIGLIYLNELNDSKQALENFSNSISIWRKMNDRYSVSITLHYIASALFASKNYKSCVDTAKLSLALALESKSLSSQMSAHQWLYKAFEQLNQKDLAFDHYKNFTAIKDSISNDNGIREITEMQLNYDFEKQRDKDSIAHEFRKQIAMNKKQAIIESQQQINNWLIAGSVIMFLFIVWIWIVLQRNKKAKKEIALQKLLIEQRNLEVMDSIKYASRIQNAILPPEEQVQKLIPEHFILYLPKDIVSGDFYWFEERNDYLFFAVVDCTGHGVPGAFMSIVGRNGLNDAVNIAGLTSAPKILDYLNHYVNETLHQRFENSSVRDGMDIALCVLNKTTNEIDFAGANNPVWIHQKSKNDFIEFKGDKQPIGNFVGLYDIKPFNSKKIKLEKGDTMYLFSDGYADQFGGPKGKKLKYKRLKEKLITVCSNDLKFQKNSLVQLLNDWKGDMEQIDDICIVGIKL